MKKTFNFVNSVLIIIFSFIKNGCLSVVFDFTSSNYAGMSIPDPREGRMHCDVMVEGSK